MPSVVANTVTSLGSQLLHFHSLIVETIITALSPVTYPLIGSEGVPSR
jgi:hypothetical protein